MQLFNNLHSESDVGTVMRLYERALQEHKLGKVHEKLEDFAIKVVLQRILHSFIRMLYKRILHDLRSAILKMISMK